MKFFIVGIACFVVSICFGLQNSVDVTTCTGITTSSDSSWKRGSVQNTTAAGASAGFAIAGGLSLIACALDKKDRV